MVDDPQAAAVWHFRRRGPRTWESGARVGDLHPDPPLRGTAYVQGEGAAAVPGCVCEEFSNREDDVLSAVQPTARSMFPGTGWQGIGQECSPPRPWSVIPQRNHPDQLAQLVGRLGVRTDRT